MIESIRVQNLTKVYDGKTVVNDLSFRVLQGEVFGLLGHNGAGKSTTIECILGLTKPTTGQTLLLGCDAGKHRSEIFEQVGVQLQQTGYQNNIRVQEICEEMAALYKKPNDYRMLLKQFGLADFRQQPVHNLSGGEKQKLSLVLALLPDPKMIFLDELTTGLDVAARREVWKFLKGLKQQGKTIFLTTHYMEEAQNLCDHLLIMKEGRQIAEGTLKEIIQESPYNSLEEAYLWYVGERNYI